MSKAILSYTLNKNSSVETDELILLTGSLRKIDNCTKLYESAVSIRNSPEYQEQINSFIKKNMSFIQNHNNGFEGEFVVSFIVDSDNREYLPLLLNDDKQIRTRTSALEDVKSETEKARKLLFKSKDKLFLRRMLKDERFADTTDFDIKLKLQEYKEIVKKGFKPKLIDGEYYLTIHQILEYALETEKFGLMRGIIEDALEVWKENILSLNDEELYYYSRHLRIAMNNYDREKLGRKTVTHLKADINNIVYLFRTNKGKINRYPIQGTYQITKSNKTKRIEECFS